MESIYLAGSEEIRNAASRMARAAEQMNHAAREFEDSLQRHQRFMDDWLLRLGEVLGPLQK